MNKVKNTLSIMLVVALVLSFFSSCEKEELTTTTVFNLNGCKVIRLESESQISFITDCKNKDEAIREALRSDFK